MLKLPPPRSEFVVRVQDEVMELLREHQGSTQQLRPDEGYLAIELVILTLFTNAMEAAPVEQREAVREFHMRTIVRLSSRIAAWPAKSLDAKDRM